MQKMLWRWLDCWAEAKLVRTPRFRKWKYEFRGYTLKTLELIDVVKEAFGWNC